MKTKTVYLILILFIFAWQTETIHANSELANGSVKGVSLDVKEEDSLQLNYDAAGRLDRVCKDSGLCTLYTYDPNGNLLTRGRSRNLSLPNAGFEKGLESIGYYVGSNGSIAVDTNQANTGSKSIRVSPPQNSDSWVFQTHHFGSDITGKKFTVTANVKTSDLKGGVKLLIYWTDSSGNWIWGNTIESNTLSGTNNWTKLSATAIAPYGAVSVTPMIAAHQGTGYYWIDDMSVTEVASTRFLLFNPSFEQGLLDIGYYVGSDGTIKTDTLHAHTGSKSLQVTPPSNELSWQFENYHFNKDISGRKFAVAMYVKTEELVGGVKLMIYWIDSSGNWIWSNITESETKSGTNGWTKLITTSEAPIGAVSVTPMIVALPGSGKYWIDSMEVFEP